MKSRLIYLTVALFTILSLIPLAMSAPARAATSHVYSGQSIQATINNSAAGDTIIVHDGTYNENIGIDKPLTIISDNGSASTIIDGTAGGDQPAVTIINSSVTFGTTGHGFGVTHTWYDAGNESGGMGIAVMNLDDSSLGGITVQGNYVYECGGGPGGSGAGIALGNMGTGNLHDNLVSGNEVFNCSMGIVMINMGAADIYENIIEDNEVHMAGVPVGLINLAPGTEIYSNELLNNEIYDSGFCILLSGYGGNIYGNLIEDNSAHDSFLGITLGEVAGFSGVTVYENIVESNEVYNCGGGIVMSIEGTGAVYGNTVRDNIVHNMSPAENAAGNGIALFIMASGNVTGNLLNRNEIYNCVTGIQLWDGGTGNLQDTRLYSNSIYNNSEGISISNSQYAYVYGNDIRDNFGVDTGIYLRDSDEIYIRCNNIAGNDGCGVANDGSTNVDADDNWWGDGGGPGVNGSNDICGMTVTGWLSQEHVINASADPPSIPDAGNYSTVLSLEQPAEEGCCNASSVSIDVSALLLDLLPADFEQRYVSTWSGDAQDDWSDWLSNLSEIGMDYNESEHAWNYELDLEELLVDGLTPFFSYEGGGDDYAGLIDEELRLGDFQVPAYLNNDGCGTLFTASIPLTITVPTPIPTPAPTPTPSPTPTRRPGRGGYIPPESSPTPTPTTTATAMPTVTASPSPSPTGTPASTATATPAPTATPGPSVTPPGGTQSWTIDFRSTGTGGQDLIDDKGILLADIASDSSDGTVTARIAAGTQITDSSGQPVYEITIEAAATTPPVPEGYFLIEAFDFEPDGTVFSSALQITLAYDLSQLPAGQEPVIAYYDEAKGEWVFLIGEVDAATGTITFSIAHFTTYVLMGLSATPAGGDNIAPWVWIMTGIVALLSGILLISAVMRRRAVAERAEVVGR